MKPLTFKWKGKEVYQRKPGYSNAEMAKSMALIAGVVNATIEKKAGRGKNSKTINVLKHPNTEPKVREIINDSVDYYKEKMNKIEFRDYQEEIIAEGIRVLKDTGLLYLAMEVRTGKTLTSLGICEGLDVDNVLFITKKKAISSITDDSDKLCPSFVLFTINYESLHKIPDIKWDVIICDEAHSMGAFPKPSKRAKEVKALLQKNRSARPFYYQEHPRLNPSVRCTIRYTEWRLIHLGRSKISIAFAIRTLELLRER